MTNKGGDRQNVRTQGEALGRDDATFVARMREAYRAPERTPVRDAAFDARLAERLQEKIGVAWWKGAVVAAAAAISAILVIYGTDGESPPAASNPRTAKNALLPLTGDGANLASEASPAAIEDAIVALAYGSPYEDDGSSEGDRSESQESLPKDYVAIASLFLGE